ncbi:purine-cytosine permease family protein [Cytobacillus sp. BC1816]|uniref:purine-cytosine permease family protein n=1 Tax=Cytobacillus sp. BC1816 TaxID=3440154 RepID=UPI003F515C6F
MNVNLLSRGGGFGYIGASLTSIIYATNFIMYFALEGLILVAAVHEFLPAIPKWALVLFFGTIVIPLNWFGIKQLDKLQKWLLPLFGIFLIAAIVVALSILPVMIGVFGPICQKMSNWRDRLIAMYWNAARILGLTPLLTSDYARFLKPKDTKIGISAIGFVPQIFCFGVMGGIGIWFGVRLGEPNPGVYIVLLLGIWGALFTMITQIRINVTNIYSGSLSLSNFFENVFKFKPGRRFWVVVPGISAIILMLGDIVNHLETVLTFQGVFLLSWAAILVTDAVYIKKILRIGPGYYEARQQNLYKWNPVGVGSLLIATSLGTVAALGLMGTFLQSTAAFFAALLASIITIILAVATKGKYYIKQEANDNEKNEYIA